MPDEPQKAVRRPFRAKPPGGETRRRTGPRPVGRPAGFPLPYIHPEPEEKTDVAGD